MESKNNCVHFSFIIEVHLKGREANKLVKWETFQKENFLVLESKKQRGTDSERLKRMTAK